MKITGKGIWIAAGLMLMFTVRPGAAQSSAGEQESSSRQRYAELMQIAQATTQNPTASEPATAPATQSTAPASQTVPPAQGQSQTQTQTQDKKDNQPPTAQQQQGVTQRPAGTAAAETDTAGVAASRPAGMAIAPAKQHRSRAFWVKMGAIAGAGVALGTTLGLSKATNSKPPGTH